MGTYCRVRVLLLMFLGMVGRAAAAEDSGSGPTLFTGDLGNILWTLITFIAVLVVLGKFAWGPILRGLQSREDFIRESLENARRDRAQAEATLKEYERKLAAARAEASAIVEEGRRDAEVLKQKIEDAARKEADAMISRARREIAIATNTAVKELYEVGTKLATQVAALLIQKELDATQHQRLIERSIEELDRQYQTN